MDELGVGSMVISAVKRAQRPGSAVRVRTCVSFFTVTAISNTTRLKAASVLLRILKPDVLLVVSSGRRRRAPHG
jgi:hypothetical protein